MSYILVRQADLWTCMGELHLDMYNIPLIVYSFTPLDAILHVLSTEVDALSKLPRFDRRHENSRRNEHNSPLPGDWSMLEDFVVDDGNIDLQNK